MAWRLAGGGLPLAVCLLLAAVQLSQQHGLMVRPMSRNYHSFKFDKWPDTDYQAHEKFAGGVRVISRNKTLLWPAGEHGLCGDRADAKVQKYMAERPITANYTQGDVVDLHVALTTNHWGRFEFRVCPRGSTKESQCQLLQRADGKGPWWYVPEVTCCDGKGRPTIPKKADGFYSWYYLRAVNDDFAGTPTFMLRYRLPASFSCDRCILQWYYLTGNTCNPGPCNPADPYHPNCDRMSMGYCGTRLQSYPEEFWNCADVAIRPRRK